MSELKNKDRELIARLQRDGVNVSQVHTIEFNIDFTDWPPPVDAIDVLKNKYGNIKSYEPDRLNDIHDGYLAVRVNSILTAEFVAEKQKQITAIVSQFGGYCNTWAVILHAVEI